MSSFLKELNAISGRNTSRKIVREAKTLEVQVVDQEDALRTSKRFNVKASPSSLDDEISVDITTPKDRANVIAWMLKSGWEAEDLYEVYPEVLGK